jgi:hypothetical protein
MCANGNVCFLLTYASSAFTWNESLREQSVILMKNAERKKEKILGPFPSIQNVLRN